MTDVNAGTKDLNMIRALLTVGLNVELSLNAKTSQNIAVAKILERSTNAEEAIQRGKGKPSL